MLQPLPPSTPPIKRLSTPLSRRQSTRQSARRSMQLSAQRLTPARAEATAAATMGDRVRAVTPSYHYWRRIAQATQARSWRINQPRAQGGVDRCDRDPSYLSPTAET